MLTLLEPKFPEPTGDAVRDYRELAKAVAAWFARLNEPNVLTLTKARVDSSPIGASEASTGKFTTLQATSTLGYTTGAGGAVTQLTSKATGVTLNKACGEITMHNAALAADTTVAFTLTNSFIAATDVIVLNHVTTGTGGAYTLNGHCSNGTAAIYVRNVTAGSLSEAIGIRFAVIKAVTS